MDPSSTWPWLAMTPTTKTYISFGLVILALVEFFTVMHVLGKKGSKPFAREAMKAHRILGYVFFAYFVWISWVCFDMMARLSAAGGYELDARGAGHGALALTLLVLWLLKVAFVRLYRTYRPYVPLLGFVLVVGTLVLWGVAGWMFLWLVGTTQAVRPL